MEITVDDVHAAKDALIAYLTNAVIRAQAENSALKRELDKEEPDGSDG